MVTALLRALGFDDEAEAPPGEGQDRAPVGAGQDVPEDVTQARQRSVRGAADQYIGTPYHMGGSTAQNIDCSGLVNALLRGFGANIPAGHGPATTGWRNGQMATPIPWESIQPGDVLLSPANARDPQAGEHMALYVGGGQMVEAAGPEGAPVRYAAVTNRNLQPYRMREPVPGLQQVTLMAQREGDVPQQAPPAPGAAAGGAAPSGPASIQRLAMNAGASDEVAEIMAAGAKTESGVNPQAVGDNGHSVGIYQMHDQGRGAGMSTQERADPATATAAMVPHYMEAYRRAQAQGYRPEDVPLATYFAAELPRDMSPTGPNAQRFRANYTEVTQQSAQRNELQVGGGYAPPSGGPGQANAGAPSGPLQQAWEASAPLRQQLQAAFGGAAEAVAGLGATPAHAAPEPQGPPPPPDAARDTANRQAAADRETALAAQRQTEASQAPAAAGAALGQPALTWGGGRNAPPPTPTAPPPPAPPAAPTDYGPGGFAGAAQAAGGAPGGMIRPSGAPVTSLPGQPAAPSTAPAAGIAETAPPPPGLPPDTETEHWDNRIRAWVPKTPPPGVSYPGHWELAPGVTPATTSEGLNALPASNPPGTPVQYVPNQPGPYPQGYWDGSNWHAPTAGSRQQQGVQVHDMGGGLRFSQPDPNSPNGTWLWTDPGSGVTRSAPGSINDPTPPADLQQPTQAPMTEYQRTTSGQTAAQNDTTNQQWWADYQQRVAQTDVTNSVAQQRLAQEAQTHADEMALRQRQASIPTQVGTHIYGPDPNNPDPNAPPIDLGPVPTTPGQDASTAYTQAQTNRMTQESTLPTVVNHRVYTPVTNPDTGVASYQDTGPESMSASEQALADERAHEFGTLSAYQQSQADQSKASLAQNESQFQQNLSEKQAESARPYQQMTKAEQARAGIEQAQLGLDTQKLGLQENQAANQLENLPRGGIMRVDPFTGQSSLVNAPEPEDIRMVGSQIYIPGGRQVSMLGQQITGGPNPYAGVPTGGGGMFQYPGAQGGQQSPYQNWGGQGGAGWGGQQQMSGSPGWAPPQQPRQGWMGSGY